MEFAVFATWDHGAFVADDVYGRIDRALPRRGRPCLSLDESGQRYVTLGIDVEASGYEDAIELGRATVAEVMALGPLVGRAVRIVASTDQGQLVWDASQ